MSVALVINPEQTKTKTKQGITYGICIEKNLFYFYCGVSQCKQIITNLCNKIFSWNFQTHVATESTWENQENVTREADI